MMDLSPWQRWALDTLHGRDMYTTPFRSPLRVGCQGLVEKGLAETAPPVHGRYRITEAGNAEWERRHRNDQDAAA